MSMNILKYFKQNKKSSANTAKERLQIIISHERVKRQRGDNIIPLLQKDLLSVITKYFNIGEENLKDIVKVEVDREGDHSVLELNITLPDVEVAEPILELEEA